MVQHFHHIRAIKARVYNPGELASELARFESGTSSKFHPPSPSHQCSVQSHAPTSLNAHLAVGLTREKEMPEHDAAIQVNLDTGTTYCAMVDSNRNRWGLPEGGAKLDQSRNAMDPYLWKLGRLMSHSHG